MSQTVTSLFYNLFLLLVVVFIKNKTVTKFYFKNVWSLVFYNLRELKDLLQKPDNKIACLLHGQLEKASVDGSNIGILWLWAFDFSVTEAAGAHIDRRGEPP